MSFSRAVQAGALQCSQPSTPDLRVVIDDDQTLGLGRRPILVNLDHSAAKAAFLHNFVILCSFDQQIGLMSGMVGQCQR